MRLPVAPAEDPANRFWENQPAVDMYFVKPASSLAGRSGSFAYAPTRFDDVRMLSAVIVRLNRTRQGATSLRPGALTLFSNLPRPDQQVAAARRHLGSWIFHFRTGTTAADG
jgi:hypothetical protein